MELINEMLLPCACTFAASIGFALLFNLKGKNILLAAVGGVLCQIVFMPLESYFSSVMPAYFLSAAAITIYSEIMAKIMKEPAPVYLVVSFIPLVPGGEIYFAMISSFTGNTDVFMTKLLHTLAIAGSVAMGVLTVTSLIRAYKLSSLYVKQHRKRLSRKNS